MSNLNTEQAPTITTVCETAENVVRLIKAARLIGDVMEAAQQADNLSAQLSLLIEDLTK